MSCERGNVSDESITSLPGLSQNTKSRNYYLSINIPIYIYAYAQTYAFKYKPFFTYKSCI